MLTTTFKWRSLSVGLGALLLAGCASWKELTTRQQGPRSAGDWAEIGLVFESQGRTSQAVECFEKSLELEPSNTVLQEKIASLRVCPKAEDGRTSLATVNEVFRRYGEAGSLEHPDNTLRPPKRKHRVAAVSSTEEKAVEDMKLGSQSALPEEDSRSSQWSR
jgi:hypothetical protein